MKRIIDKEHSGDMLKDFLKKEMAVSSSTLKKLKKVYGALKVNGEHKNVNYILKNGDTVEIDICDTEGSENIVLSPIKTDIIYEDENITVVNKSAGMPTHPSINHYDDTLANALAYRYKDRPYVFRALNRLDKNTSGVVLTSNNRYFSSVLSDKMKKGEIQKTYIAIVKGKTDGNGIISAPIKRIEESIIKRAVCDDGAEAITEYQTLMSCDEISVVKAMPKTGRTHQLRIHFSHIGHPILGDDLYGEKSELMERHALHAIKMKIEGIGVFTAPVPEDMMKVIRRYFGENVKIIP